MRGVSSRPRPRKTSAIISGKSIVVKRRAFSFASRPFFSPEMPMRSNSAVSA